LSSVEGVDGLKTGYTKKSGWGVAVSALREGRRITVVLSGTNSSKSRFEETSKLLDWAFTHTFQKKSQTKKKDFCEIYPKASSCISSIDTEDTASDILEEVSKPVF
jgi:D-alanyl-D-alanine carboxypeptidase